MNDRFTYPVERFKGFSDAVFAIAITLLVLKFALPASLPAKPTVSEEVGALIAIWPQYLTYFVGFSTIGVVWLNHSALFRNADNITHGIMIANLLLLFFVVLMPLPTAVLERFGLTRVSVVCYGLTLTAIAFSYVLLRSHFLAAHPSERTYRPALGLLTVPLFPIMTIVAYFKPLIGLLGFAVATIIAMLPRTIPMGQWRSPSNSA